jgi:putative selenate reductase molybdopterin-binding subunit
MDGVAPAVGNAVLDACGADVMDIPITPERLWRTLKRSRQSSVVSHQQELG